MSPSRSSVVLVVNCVSGAIWKIPIDLIATEPLVDNVLVIKSAEVGKMSAVGFRLTSTTRCVCVCVLLLFFSNYFLWTWKKAEYSSDVVFCVQEVGAVHSSAASRQQQGLYGGSFLGVFTPCWLRRQTHHRVLHTNLSAQRAQSQTHHPGIDSICSSVSLPLL